MSDHLGQVWEQSVSELTRLVAGMGCQGETGQDVLQDVYLAAMRSKAGQLAPPELRCWLFRTVINRCHLEHRRHGIFARAVLGWFLRRPPRADTGNAADHATQSEQLSAVRQAMERLEGPERAILVMRYFNEMDSREIGKVLGTNDSTVRTRLRRARMKLAQELRKAGHEHQ